MRRPYRASRTRMDETEGLGESYCRVPVPRPFRTENELVIHGLTAYLDRRILSLHGAPVRLTLFAHGDYSAWRTMNEAQL